MGSDNHKILVSAPAILYECMGVIWVSDVLLILNTYYVKCCTENWNNWNDIILNIVIIQMHKNEIKSHHICV